MTATAEDELRFTSVVSRELVHKAAIEQVLVCDFAALGGLSFACSAHAPRAHAYWNDALAPRHDGLMLLESGRQAFVSAVHRLIDVPASSRFVFSAVDMRIDPLEALAIAPRPSRLVWRARIEQPRYVRGDPVSANVAGALAIDGVQCLRFTGGGAFMSERLYRLLRRRKRAAGGAVEPSAGLARRIDPARVGRRDPGNVVIGDVEPIDGGGVRAAVIVDPAHSSFFDHPLDHVPAMLLVEALRQAAIVAAGEPPRTLALQNARMSYGRYAELDARVTCTAVPRERAGSGIEVDVALAQGGAAVARGRLTLGVLA